MKCNFNINNDIIWYNLYPNSKEKNESTVADSRVVKGEVYGERAQWNHFIVTISAIKMMVRVHNI